MHDGMLKMLELAEPMEGRAEADVRSGGLHQDTVDWYQRDGQTIVPALRARWEQQTTTNANPERSGFKRGKEMVSHFVPTTGLLRTRE